MAKKQSISYGPDSALIRGEADVARSQAMLSSAGGTAFAQGLTGAVISGIQEQEERNSIRDAYLDDLRVPREWASETYAILKKRLGERKVAGGIEN